MSGQDPGGGGRPSAQEQGRPQSLALRSQGRSGKSASPVGTLSTDNWLLRGFLTSGRRQLAPAYLGLG